MKIFLVTFTFFISISLFAQQKSAADVKNFNPRFEVFKLPDDIYGNSVQGMVQDKTGFLWFATQGGLLRFDGQNFDTYRYDAESLSDNVLSCVAEDHQGFIWIGK